MRNLLSRFNALPGSVTYAAGFVDGVIVALIVYLIARFV